MKRFAILLAAFLVCSPALPAQEQKTDQPGSRGLQNKVFQVRHRDPRSIYSAVRLLLSPSKDASVDYNEDLHTITVRDFPENIAVIGQAIERLDEPAPRPAPIELKISVLIGSTSPLPGSTVPDDLAPVIKQLESTLRYTHYGLLTANVHRTQAGEGFDGSGVAEPTLLGMTAHEGQPIFYSYRLGKISVDTTAERPSVSVEHFNFSMKVPINLGSAGIQYQPVGFEAPVTVRQSEKVVIGTTTMGEKALIVVVTANVEK